MIKFPFSFKSKDDSNARPSAAFSAYCQAELERLRDTDETLDEARFKAAVELALSRLRTLERKEKA